MIKILIIYSVFYSVSFANEKKPEISQQNFDKKVEQELNKILLKVTGPKMAEFSKSLLQREKKLNQWEKDLGLRGLELKKAEEELVKKITELTKEQTKIIGCLSDNEKERKGRITHLDNIVSGMKPQTAANMLSVQDSKLSVEIISNLDPAKVSKIFNLMDKEISARLQKEYLNMQR